MRKSIYKDVLSNKDSLEKAVIGCDSISDVFKKLNISLSSARYRMFHKMCEEFGIEEPKFDYGQCARNTSRKNTRPLKEILVENSDYDNRQLLKRRCVAAGLLKDECYECGRGPTWNRKPLTLQLDHINGVSNDNRIENLRVLCPNCHSQTDAFAGRRFKKPKPKKIYKSGMGESEDFRVADRPNSRKFEVSRDVLEELLAKHSVVCIGKQFGVSDKAITRRSKRLEIEYKRWTAIGKPRGTRCCENI